MNLDQPSPGVETPEALRGLVEVHPVATIFPAVAAPGLPADYLPKSAGYAVGPFLEPQFVAPALRRWRNCHTYIVTDLDGCDWRAIRVTAARELVGYWAVEMLGTPFDLED